MRRFFLLFAYLIALSVGVHAAPVSPEVLAEIAPTGKLRVGINIGNLLLTGKNPISGKPQGIPFDLATELGKRLNVPVEITTFDSAGKLADSAKCGVWDIAFLGIEPERAEVIQFSDAYAEIQSTYLVPAGSTLKHANDVDRDGVRIAISDKSAYDLYLTRHLHHASLVRVPGVAGVPGLEGAFNVFAGEKLEALAGLKPVLLVYAEKLPGSRVLDGEINIVKQAIGTQKGRKASVKYLNEFIADIKSNGFIKTTLEKNGAKGISVAP